MEYYVWADGTYVAIEDFVEEEWSYMSDDYVVINVPEELEEDSQEFEVIIRKAINR